jgi:EH domain-containing protein 1
MTLKTAVAGGVALAFLVIWAVALRHLFFNRFHRRMLKKVDSLTSLFNQTRKDSWESVREQVVNYLKNYRRQVLPTRSASRTLSNSASL